MKTNRVRYLDGLLLVLAGALVATLGLAGETNPSDPKVAATRADAGGVVTIQPGREGRAAITVKRLEAITIPTIELAQANLVDVVAFLNKVSLESDKDAQAGKAKGLNFILNLGSRPAPSVTFTARSISLMTALKIVTQMAGTQYHIEDNVIMIVPREDEGK